jgi:nucleotide-binding universal stress UspA family protein
VRVAGLIARATGADITLVRLDWSRRSRRPELAAAVAELNRIGAEPLEILTPGLPARKIPELAARERASLVVVGSRGLNGTRAISSISERVAHAAPCSVLIVRPPADDR